MSIYFVHHLPLLKFQKNLAYKPPKNFNGSILDGRDISSIVVPDAHIKIYITANINIRARRRFKELKKLGKKVKFDDIFRSMKKRDKDDRTRKHSRLKKSTNSTRKLIEIVTKATTSTRKLTKDTH